MRSCGAAVVWVCLWLLASLSLTPCLAQTASPLPLRSPADRAVLQNVPAEAKLTITVTDENGVAVRSARVLLQPPPPALGLHCETDFAGRCEFSAPPSGPCDLHVEKTGYYAISQRNVRADVTPNVDVTLSHQQQAHVVVNVTESTPAIDPAQVSTKEELTGTELIDIPYPGPNDYRNALLFIPGTSPDAFGQVHFAGAETYQTLLLLDGFNVTQPTPTNGQLALRTSIDSFRSIEVTPSREPAEFGKGSGGVLALNTRMGDDHFRASAIDFFPDFQEVKGISLGQWTPIYTVSGPIRKGKVWYIDALSGEYDNNITKQLPSDADADHVWTMDNLAKLQSNLTTRHIVTASFLSNYHHDEYDGLSLLQPQPTTPTDAETALLGSLKDQYYFHGGALLETGFGVDQYSATLTPQGDSSYIQLAPTSPGTQTAAGNYYLHENSLTRREQLLTNLYLPPHQWHGRHDLKAGFDLDRLQYDAQFLRQPISFLEPGQPPVGQLAAPCPTDSNGVPIVPSPTCTRYSVFTPGNYNTMFNSEASAYVEDRWLITNRLLIEPGLRFDWDEIIRTPLFSPRLAGTYILDDEGNTKLSAGIGIVYDGTSLGLIHQPLEGTRTDYFFDTNGCPQEANGTSVPCQPPAPLPAPVPVQTTFIVNRNNLEAPRYVNWSLGLEKKLPYAIFIKLEFLEKRGTHGFAYNTLNGAVDGDFVLGNARDDHYTAFQVSVRHRFRQYHEIFGAYTRSRSTTNQVFDFSVDFPLLSSQLPGPFPWDTPNRFVGYGIVPFFKLPVVHKVDMVYSYEARTGLPFFATTDQGEISPNLSSTFFRLPTYYSINLQFEKRFHLFKRYWALRGGFDNVTNHANAAVASSVIDPSHPAPTFIDNNGRVWDSRIIFLGRQ
jgi:TonB dependent receptor/Carboxypeptidase regulatory-like domain